MRKSTYAVWWVLFDIPNKWVDVMEVAYLANLTSRQVSAIVVKNMPSPPVLKRRHPLSHSLQVMLEGSSEQIKQYRQQIMTECYNITDDMLDKVYNSLSPAGWMSTLDITFDTGIDRLNVTRALSILDGVIIRDSGSGLLYRRER